MLLITGEGWPLRSALFFCKKVAKKFSGVRFFVYIYTVIKSNTMQVKVKINILNLIGAITALLVTISILNGTAQEVVHFAGAANEIGAALMSAMLTIALAATSFERIK